MTALAIDRVSYRYAARTDALHDVSLTVPRGAILGLLGANGAGKSTLLHCCAGLRTPTQGTITLDGAPVRHRRMIEAGRLTWLSATPQLPGRMTVDSLQRWVAPLHPRWDAPFARELQHRFALDGATRVDALSRGGVMKLALLLALAPRPAVALLDEPLGGLDLPAREDVVRSIVTGVADSGTTVLLASHEIAEIEHVIDHVAMLRNGRLVLDGAMDMLRERYRQVTLAGAPDRLDTIARTGRWLSAASAGRTLALIVDTAITEVPGTAGTPLDGIEQLSNDEVPLRTLYTSLAHTSRTDAPQEVAA